MTLLIQVPSGGGGGGGERGREVEQKTVWYGQLRLGKLFTHKILRAGMEPTLYMCARCLGGNRSP